MLNDLLGFVIALVFGAWLLSFVIGGIRRGRIHHKGQPRRFIAVALLFCVFASMFGSTSGIDSSMKSSNGSALFAFFASGPITNEFEG